MAGEWYYKLMGEVIGPISSIELKQLARAGDIRPDTHVRKGPDGRWVMAERVKGLLESTRYNQQPSADDEPVIATVVSDVFELDPFEFEALVIRLLRAMGLAVQDTKKTGDGGIDALAESTEPITGGTYIVQCKRYSSNVGEPAVRDLYGTVMHAHASKGILITTSNFTQQAQTFADGKPLELINGASLRALLARYDIAPLPSGRSVMVVPSAGKHIYQGLLKIKNHIDGVLARAEIERSYGRQRHTLDGFQKLLGHCIDNVSVALGNTDDALNDLFASELDGVSREVVDTHIDIVRGAVDEILRCRKRLLGVALDSQYGNLKHYAVAMFDGYLRQFSAFIDKLSPLVELDGQIVDGDVHLSLTFDPDIQNAVDRYSAELKRVQGASCFVATVIYGSLDAWQVQVLREYRDTTLRRTVAGRATIRCYYFVGPSLARLVRANVMLKVACTWLLDKVVQHLRQRRGKSPWTREFVAGHRGR